MIDEELFAKMKQASKEAANKSYSPYSGFKVGASVVSRDGQMFQGTNVENASYGLTVCAERVAILQAVLAEAVPLVAVVIYTPTQKPVASCGSCRQFFQEFAPNATVYSTCDGPEVLSGTVNELLPGPFKPGNLTVKSVSASSHQNNSIKNPRMCVDIDNVVAQTDKVMRKVIQDVTDDRVVLEYEDITKFDYRECKDSNDNFISPQEWHIVHERFSDPEYITAIEPVDGVQECLNRLSDSYIIHFATARLPKARSHTIEWLNDNGFPSHDIHFLKHSEKHISLGKFDVSVEDDPNQALAFSSSGFGHNFIIAHPWNAGIKDSDTINRVSGWDEIEMKLTKSFTS